MLISRALAAYEHQNFGSALGIPTDARHTDQPENLSDRCGTMQSGTQPRSNWIDRISGLSIFRLSVLSLASQQLHGVPLIVQLGPSKWWLSLHVTTWTGRGGGGGGGGGETPSTPPEIRDRCLYDNTTQTPSKIRQSNCVGLSCSGGCCRPRAQSGSTRQRTGRSRASRAPARRGWSPTL